MYQEHNSDLRRRNGSSSSSETADGREWWWWWWCVCERERERERVKCLNEEEEGGSRLNVSLFSLPTNFSSVIFK